MKQYLYIIIFSFLVSCNISQSDSKSIKNQQFRDINEISEFSDFEDIGGSVIDDTCGIGSYRHIKTGSTRLIVFEKFYKEFNPPKYSILDTLLIANIPKNHFIDFGTCRYNGKNDPEIIVLYEYEEDVEFYTIIKKAWRADRKTQKIIQIETAGIDCINEGFGV